MPIRRLLLTLTLLLLSLAANAALIKDIIDNPRFYVDRTVVVEGQVETVVSLVLLKYFTVNDGSGSINVVTTQPLPRKGERIRVMGKVHEVFSFGSETLLVMVEEKAPASLYTSLQGHI